MSNQRNTHQCNLNFHTPTTGLHEIFTQILQLHILRVGHTDPSLNKFDSAFFIEFIFRMQQYEWQEKMCTLTLNLKLILWIVYILSCILKVSDTASLTRLTLMLKKSLPQRQMNFMHIVVTFNSPLFDDLIWWHVLNYARSAVRVLIAA